MSWREKLRHLSHDELKELAAMCAGVAFLLGIALVLSGSLYFLPTSLKVALQQNTSSQPAAAYWATQIGAYGGAYPSSMNCTVNDQSGSYPPTCLYGVIGGALSVVNTATNIGQTATGNYSCSAHSSCSPGCSGNYAFRGGGATGAPLVVPNGTQIQLDWACQPSQYASEYLACGDGWRYYGAVMYSTSHVVDTNGTTYPASVSDNRLGSATINMTGVAGSTTGYNLYCNNDLEATVSVSISLNTTTFMSLSASPPSAPSGTGTTLTLSASNVTSNSCSIKNSAGATIWSDVSAPLAPISFTSTGADQTYTPAAGVYGVLIKMWGAGGGGWGGAEAGGAGGYTTASLPVTPGQQYKVIVGRGGVAGAGATYGGGGGAGNGYGAAGGGRSALCSSNGGTSGQCAARINELLTAGGGGGGYAYGIYHAYPFNTQNGNGGAGGGLSGEAGYFDYRPQAFYAGGPGTQTGAGGSPASQAGGGGGWYNGGSGSGAGGGSGYCSSVTQCTTTTGSGATPPNKASSDYPSGVGSGTGNPGGNGFVKIFPLTSLTNVSVPTGNITTFPQTYTLTCTGATGSAMSSSTVITLAPPPPTATISAGAGNGVGVTIYNGSPVTITSTYALGAGTDSFVYTAVDGPTQTNGTNCASSATGVSGIDCSTSATTKTFTFTPATTGTYTFVPDMWTTAYPHWNNNSTNASVTVTVVNSCPNGTGVAGSCTACDTANGYVLQGTAPNNGCFQPSGTISTTLTATPTRVRSGTGSTNLSWATTGMTGGCTLKNDAGATLSTQTSSVGTAVTGITHQTVFTLSCSDAIKTYTSTATVSLVPSVKEI